MAVLQMQRLNLVALKQNRKAILERLQELGALELDINLDSDAEVVHQDTSSAKALFEKNASLADQAVDILDKYAPEKTSLLDSLAGMPYVERSEYDKVVTYQKEYMQQANQILLLEKKISENTSSIQKNENLMETLVPWQNLDVPMNLTGTKSTALLIGMMPEQVTADAVQKVLESHEPPVSMAEVQILNTEKDFTYLAVLCLKAEAENAETALRESGFARPSIFLRKTPQEEQQRLEKENEQLQAEIETKTKEIVEMAPAREELKLVSDYYRLRAQKYEVLGTVPQTKTTFALSGYIPACTAGEVAEEMKIEYGAAVELEEIGEKEKPPVLLKNNKISESVEGIVSSYGLPSKGEVDPTTITSIFYIVLFGMMLSDAGYGLVIAIGCGAALLKFKRMNPGLRKSLKMFFFCGISTVVWGLLFGGFFGDAIGIVSKTFANADHPFHGFWFEPLGAPMRLLLYSLTIGVIHMFVGMGIKGYMLLKKGKVLDFFCDVVAWYMFLEGLLLLLVSSSIFQSMASGTEFERLTISPPLHMFAIIITLVGLIVILLMAGRRKKKKVVMRILLGVYDIYGITSWLSDWLSYSRLLALGLATGAIAQVVNMICQMGHDIFGGVVGAIVFIVIFLIGHVLNMAINILSAYVHTNRLQFVEFFGKFYDGGSKAFEPFKAVTKYVEYAKTK